MSFIFQMRKNGLLQELMSHHVTQDSRHFLYDVSPACLGGNEPQSSKKLILYLEMFVCTVYALGCVACLTIRMKQY